MSGLDRWRLDSLFPLFAKELVERAANRDTYMYRTMYMVCVLIAGGFALWIHNRYFDPKGGGASVLYQFFNIQMIGLYVFQPVMMAGVISSERSRGTLPLLMLTGMGAGQIVWQKLMGAVTPMLILVFSGAPLMAICYSYGGVEMKEIGLLVYLLTLTAIQLGAITLMCSAYARSTLRAIMATFGLLLAPLLFLLIWNITRSDWLKVVVDYFLAPVIPLMNYHKSGLDHAVATSWAPWLSVFVAMALAQRFLVTRAKPAVRNTHAVTIKEAPESGAFIRRVWPGRKSNLMSSSLPESLPIAWRELHNVRFASRQALLRWVLFIAVLTGLVGVAISMIENQYDKRDTIVVGRLLAWFGALFFLVIATTGPFARERSNQTYDVLLVTPLTGRQIVEQKIAAAARLRWLLAVPVMVMGITQAVSIHADVGWLGITEGAWGLELSRYGVSNQAPRLAPGTLWYLSVLAIMLMIHLRLCTWVVVWLSLVARHRIRAIVTSLLVLASSCMMPMMLIAAVYQYFEWPQDSHFWYLANLSPMPFVIMLEDGFKTGLPDPRLLFLINCFGYGALAVALRWLCLRRADTLLGRVEATNADANQDASDISETINTGFTS
jgi:ABC-type transport system involved in multi-copper enzyme maturation permease subunit